MKDSQGYYLKWKVKNKLENILTIEEKLIESKMGATNQGVANHLFITMMNETHDLLELTKPKTENYEQFKK
jgi:hypothetical protein